METMYLIILFKGHNYSFVSDIHEDAWKKFRSKIDWRAEYIGNSGSRSGIQIKLQSYPLSNLLEISEKIVQMFESKYVKVIKSDKPYNNLS